jgi:hypothetical protein
MATLAAIRCNPAIKVFYQRLITAGKNHKVASHRLYVEVVDMSLFILFILGLDSFKLQNLSFTEVLHKIPFDLLA